MKKKSRQLWICTLMLAAFVPAESIYAAPTEGPATLKYEEPVFLAGAIYDPRGNQVLFKFKRNASRSGNSLRVQREFTYPDGKPAARERAVYEGDALVSYELQELQIGASGSATIRRVSNGPPQGTIEFTHSAGTGSRPKTRSETLRANTLIADMVGPFLAAQWDALQRLEKVQCRLIVVPRAETVGFTFSKVPGETGRAREGLVVKMEPSSPFVSALVDPLLFTIEQAPPHRVLQYAGRTTPKVQVGSKWKDLDAVTVFDWKTAR